MRSMGENVLWLAGAIMVGVGAVIEVKIVIICGALIMIGVFSHKFLKARRKEKKSK